MSASATAKTVQLARPRMATRWVADNEFLAPALEILETPPSPVRMALISLICAFVASGLTWSYFGWIDIVATAQGKVQPIGRVRIVQPVETGKIAHVRVANGDHVAKGDVLVEFDAGDLQAEASVAVLAYDALRAEVARRAAVDVATADESLKLPVIRWPSDMPDVNRTREEKVAAASLAQLRANLDVIEAERLQKTGERDQLLDTMRTQQQLVATLKQRVDMRTTLFHLNATALSAVIDATETLQYQLTQLAVQKGQLVTADSAIAILHTQAEKTRRDFRFDNADKLRDAQRDAANAEHAVAKARARLEHAVLRAPEVGVVQASIATNVGQVLTAGEEVLRIVPDAAGSEVEVYVLNKDIGFVEVGQDVAIKVEAFPFTRYGTINARVVAIAGDAIPEPDANKIEGRPNEPSTALGYAGAQRTQNLVFPARLKLDTNVMTVDGRRVTLTSGMAITADFRTGHRKLIDYFLSPLTEVKSRALHER